MHCSSHTGTTNVKASSNFSVTYLNDIFCLKSQNEITFTLSLILAYRISFFHQIDRKIQKEEEKALKGMDETWSGDPFSLPKG